MALARHYSWGGPWDQYYGNTGYYAGQQGVTSLPETANYYGSTGYQGATGYQLQSPAGYQHQAPAGYQHQAPTGYQQQGQGYQHQSPGYQLQSPAGYSYGIMSSFSGLDIGLTVLALLAFLVWLSNLILPQLQGAAGLGLPGLFRSLSLPQDTERITDILYTSDRDLVKDMFGTESMLHLQTEDMEEVASVLPTTTSSAPHDGVKRLQQERNEGFRDTVPYNGKGVD